MNEHSDKREHTAEELVAALDSPVPTGTLLPHFNTTGKLWIIAII